MQSDIQSSKTLLAIQHGCQSTVVLLGQWRAMWIVALVIVTDEVEEPKLTTVIWFNSPV